jgi:hypothetical protein
MSNFKGWTTENFEAIEHEKLSKRLEKMQKQSVLEARQVFAAIKNARPHKKDCTCEDYNAYAIANLSNKQFEKNCEMLMPAKQYNSPINDDFLALGTPKSMAKTEKRMLKTKKPKGETANAITANVIRAINMQPQCVAYRINNVGIWDEKKQIHRRANTQKGIFDVAAIIKGRAAWFEIKAGYDKPSQDQLIFQQEVISAGGIAEFIRSRDEFLKIFTIILLEL